VHTGVRQRRKVKSGRGKDVCQRKWAGEEEAAGRSGLKKKAGTILARNRGGGIKTDAKKKNPKAAETIKKGTGPKSPLCPQEPARPKRKGLGDQKKLVKTKGKQRRGGNAALQIQAKTGRVKPCWGRSAKKRGGKGISSKSHKTTKGGRGRETRQRTKKEKPLRKKTSRFA